MAPHDNSVYIAQTDRQNLVADYERQKELMEVADAQRTTGDWTYVSSGVVLGLWLGDLSNAANMQLLKSHNICAIVSVMRGSLTKKGTFKRYQISIDDDSDADILVHFVPAIEFIHAEMEEGHNVLVHCAAGVSRSPTVVAAYLMYTQGLDRDAALEVIKKARPFISPNASFMNQLSLFYESGFKVSRDDKPTRKFYLERTTTKITNSDDTVSIDMLAEHPPKPINPISSAPDIRQSSIRCKMCRQELATREHLLGHGQSEPITQLPSPSATKGRLVPSLHAEEAVAPSTQNQAYCSIPPTSESTQSPPPPSPASSEPASSAVISDALTKTPAELAVSTNSLVELAAERGMHTGAVPLMNPKCSGYFLEPMKWMQPVIEEGKTSGKIVCPNPRCGVKLGRYDWAGMHCACDSWVVPGFCMAKSKVDEFV